VNLGHLVHFFSAETLKDIKGDSHYQEPVQVNLPNFKIIEHEINSPFIQDETTKISLAKVAEAIRSDQILLRNTADAIVIGKVQIQTSFWTSIEGITTEIVAGVTVILVINNMYLLYKVRFLLITIAMMRSEITKAEAVDQILLDYFKEIQKSQNWAQEKHTYPNELAVHANTIQITTSGMVIFMLLVIGIITVYKLVRIFFRLPNIGKMEIYLVIYSEDLFQKIYLRKITGRFQNIGAHANDFIQDIEIQKGVRPVMKFKWSGFTLIDNLSKATYQVPNQIYLYWHQAAKLEKILGKPFSVEIVGKEGKRFQTCLVTKLETSKVD